MSLMPFQERTDSSVDRQIWNNAAFDNGEISEEVNMRSWGSLKSVFANPKSSFDSVSDKENQGLVAENQISSSVSSSLKSSMAPFNPVNVDEDDSARKLRTVKGVSRKGLQEKPGSNEMRDEKKIDEEIQQIESEIFRLKSRLETLKLEKIEKCVVKASEKRVRVIPAKFMDQKQGVDNNKEKVENSSSLGAKSKIVRRGLSLGPAEILSARRRGLSLGPSEIYGASKTKQLVKQESNSIPPAQSNRRKSCFWKLPDIDEEQALSKDKIKSCSVSPKSRKVTAKAQASSSRQAVTTISSRKTQKKEDGLINSVAPKNLFKESEKSVPMTTSKKPTRPGRVVASRYNQNASAVRKRSLPENDKDDRCEKKRSLSAGKSRANQTQRENKDLGSECRVKKRWDIPSEIVVHCSLENEMSLSPTPQSVVAVHNMLPKIKITHCKNETPRDSGAAKKVAELIGRKSYFCEDDDDEEAGAESSVRQELVFEEEDEV